MSPVIDVDKYIDEIMRERARKGGGNGHNGDHSGRDGRQRTTEHWPKPKPFPAGLAPIEPFSAEFLPDALAPWVDDIANRLQCPPDYVAVTALTALGAVIGRRIGIRPQAKTDWIEIPNIWGAFIGRPGMLKSPAMGEALKPIHRLEAEAAKENEIAQQAYAAGLDAYKLRKEVNKRLVRETLKADNKAEIDFDFGDEPKEPTPVRYRTNDSTYEGLGELLITNPMGILVERDELTSLLKHLDRDEQSVARGFYLSGWSGTQPYTFDRIMRGHRHIEAVCISVLGNTQPARIVEYVRSANLGGVGGDGLIQRFGLLAWPDAPSEWRDVDEFPNSAAREKAWRTFERMTKLDTAAALRLGAEKGQFDKVPYLRFEEAAHEAFLGWRTDLERRLRCGEMSPALEGHLAKYRKLVPSLALINHLADGRTGPVSHRAVLKALAAAHYLESHARRVYGSRFESELAAAKVILKHIRNGDLKDGFTARDVHQRGWAHLTEREQVGAGLSLLVDLDHLAPSTPSIGAEGAQDHLPDQSTEPGMNPYLGKLRARDQETRRPEEPSKPSKLIVSVVARVTTAERGFEGFEGDRGRRSADNERASGAAEQTLPDRFCRTFEDLESRCPDLVPNDRWQQAIQDSRCFLAQWGSQAEARGWTAGDLFGLGPLPDRPHPSYRRLSRYDETGLIWLLQGRRVLALTESDAAVESPTGAVTVYRRHNKPALGPLGDSLDDPP